MSKLPSNILRKLHKQNHRMKGGFSAEKALKLFTHNLCQFYDLRQQKMQLKAIDLQPYIDQKQLQHKQLYVIRIKGRKHTYYQNRILLLYMFIFDNYPQQPLEIMAANIMKVDNTEQQFLHLNFDQNGQVCTSADQTGYQNKKNNTLTALLINLEYMIYFPNIESAFPSLLFESYKTASDNNKYYKILNAQAKLIQHAQQQNDSDDSDA